MASNPEIREKLTTRLVEAVTRRVFGRPILSASIDSQEGKVITVAEDIASNIDVSKLRRICIGLEA